MKYYTVEIIIRQAITATDENVAQKRADLMARRASEGVMGIKGQWLGDQECGEATVEEEEA